MSRDLRFDAAEAANWIATVPARLLVDKINALLLDRLHTVGEPEISDLSIAAADIHEVLDRALADGHGWDVEEVLRDPDSFAELAQRASADAYNVKNRYFGERMRSAAQGSPPDEFHAAYELADLGIFVFEILFRFAVAATDDPGADEHGEPVTVDAVARQLVAGELVPNMKFSYRSRMLDDLLANASDRDRGVWASLKDGSTWEDAAAGR